MKQGIEELKALAKTVLAFDKNKITDNDLSWYKLGKNSGYSVVLLYKGLVEVETVDFMTNRAKEIKTKYPEAADWNVTAVPKYLRAWTAEQGLPLYDKRYTKELKYTVAVERHIAELKAEAGV